MLALLLKASFILAVLLVFYKLFLEKESFFSVNRIYLIACLAFAFTLPFISLPKLINQQGLVSQIIEKVESKPQENLAITNSEAVPTLESKTDALSPNTTVNSERTFADWLLIIYYFGVAIFFLNFISQVISVLYKVWKSTDKIEDENAIIINTPLVQEPCSFFNYIFINPDNYDFDTYEQILKHEKIHVSKRHSFDLLFSELAVIVLWFNPLVWFWRNEVEKNIEYQTDDELLERKAVKRDSYQMNLLKVATYTRPLTITTNYNQSLLKQRIMKMNTKKSNKQSYWKYAFIAPLLFGILLLTNNPLGAFAQEDIAQNYDEPSNSPVSNVHSEPENIRDFIFSTKGCRNLLRAVKNENIEDVKKTLKSQDPDCTYTGDGEPRTPLVAAARKGNYEIGKLILEAGGDSEYHYSMDESPLMAVSRSGNIELTHLLLEYGADVNRESRGDGTALIYAVRNKRYEIAEILLEAGADPYQNVPGDEYAMFHARASNNKKMINLLKKYEK